MREHFWRIETRRNEEGMVRMDAVFEEAIQKLNDFIYLYLSVFYH
jgi:hypothetical protein